MSTEFVVPVISNSFFIFIYAEGGGGRLNSTIFELAASMGSLLLLLSGAVHWELLNRP